jgi:hypothetical protein
MDAARDRIAALEAVINGWQLRATVLADRIEAEQEAELRYEAGMYQSLYETAKARIEALEATAQSLRWEIAKLMDKHGIAPAKPQFWIELEALISTVTSAERAALAEGQD